MNCNHLRDELVDVASGAEPVSAELEKHLLSCTGCSETLANLRQTMALMDEWIAPEPTPYFNVRLQARLREERAAASRSWLEWLRKPALGVAATLLLAAGIGLYQGGRTNLDHMQNRVAQHNQPQHVVAQRGTAVGDLQYLEKNSDMFQDFDALDALDGTSDSTAVN